MPGPLLHVGATAMCPHAGQITDIPTNTRVMVSSQPVATVADQFLVAGCPFVVGVAPQPCLTVQWIVSAARVTVMGSPALLQTSTGICQGAAPAGPPNIVTCQTRAVGQ